MDVIVVMRQVPDLGGGLALNPDGTDLDRRRVGWVTNPFDEHALEEALLLKEVLGATVTVVALDEPEVDVALYRALALGAGRAVKLVGPLGGPEGGIPGGWIPNHARARALASWIATQPYDLIVSGVQSPEDVDGQVTGLLAGILRHPHASVVVGVEPEDGRLFVTQEFGGGRLGRLELALPAVLGIQVSLRDPRYVSEMRIRLASMGGGVEEVAVVTTGSGAGSGIRIRSLAAAGESRRAEMLEGSPDEVADAMLGLLRSRGLLG